MQQPPSMIPVMSSYPPSNITTEQIQKYLDENKKLILAILDNQNLGKLTECAQYQAQLQKNLMYLAAIADAQPPTPTIPTPPQMAPPHHAMQQGVGGGGFYVQHPQAAAMAHQQQQQQAMKMPLQFNTAMHQLQDPHQQQHNAMRPGGGPTASNGMHSTLSSSGGGPPQTSGSNKQDEPGTDGGDGSEEGKRLSD